MTLTMKTTLRNTIAAAGLLPLAALALKAQDKPNFVFFMAEDLSKESFALYNGHAEQTPNLERLAAHGITYNNAYSCAPVSSAARSSLITGCYAPSLGISWHRKIDQVHLPEGVHLFPHYLRKAGYYTSNGFKTDYNCEMEKGAWTAMKSDIDGWRQRPEGAPFFHCYTNNSCHESSLHFPEADMDTLKTWHNPEQAHLYPWHPDTELFRYTYARHYDAIKGIDDVLGEMVADLEADGLLDDTFIFFMGDNGGCLPGTKSYMNEMGLNVPLVIYVPDNWKHLVPMKNGSECDAMVSFLDFAPTLLHLAGLEIPSYLDGQPILGKDVGTTDLECMDEMYCYGDRFDEMYEMTRTVRKMDFKYVRNFMPWQAEGLYCSYRYKQAAFRQWREMYRKGELNPLQASFWEPMEPEELYNLASDPYETVNLAKDPRYAPIMKKMRSLLREKMLSERDLGLAVESYWVPYVSDIEHYKDSLGAKFEKYFDTADLQTKSYSEAAKSLKKVLADDDPVVRWWALTACCAMGEDALPLKKRIVAMLNDDAVIVKAQAATWLALFCGRNPTEAYRECLRDSDGLAKTLLIVNDAAAVHERCPEMKIDLNETDLVHEVGWTKDRIKFINR